MTANPKECVLKETGKCVGWVCMECKNLHTTAIYLCPDDEAAASAHASAERCCAQHHCKCGAEVKRYSDQCSACWRAEPDAKDQARWEAAPKQTIAEYLAEEPDGWVCDDDQFWSVESYISDEVYLQHPRVYFCEASRGISLSAEDITENWADDRHEDAQDDLDLAGLQVLLDDWCAKQQTVSWCATNTALAPEEVERLIRERDAERPPPAESPTNPAGQAPAKEPTK